MSVKIENEELSVNVGDPSKDYRVGDFLTAIDQVTCWFHSVGNCDETHLADALRLYAKKVDDGI